MRLLILGGTTEASALARHLAARPLTARPEFEAVLSFAGRTKNPVAPPIPYRVGGFGGLDGLKAYLAEHRIEAVIDATHPFAAQMSRNAAAACREMGLKLAVFTRPAWQAQSGDRWTSVADIPASVEALGQPARVVFLTVGSLQLAAYARAPQHRYIVRSIDPPAAIGALPSHRLVLARGPFSVEDETALMRDEQVDVLVTKNSGGSATEAKLQAARTLGIEVVIVERPGRDDVPNFESVDAIMAWIGAHRAAP